MIAFVWSLFDLFAKPRPIGLPNQQSDLQDRTAAPDSSLSFVTRLPAVFVHTDRSSAAAHMPVRHMFFLSYLFSIIEEISGGDRIVTVGNG